MAEELRVLNIRKKALIASFNAALTDFNKDGSSGCFAILKYAFRKYEVCSEEVLGLMASEEEISEEIANQQSVCAQFILAETAYTQRAESMQNVSQAQTMNLPKLSLQEFDLTPRTWLAFWGQYLRIYSDDRLSPDDKFQYLLMTIKKNTRGRDIIDSFPVTGDSLEKAIDQLKARFGRDKFIIELLIRDILQLVLVKQTKLSVLYDQLSSKIRSLETLGVTSDKYDAILYPLVESCLTVDLLKIWERQQSQRCLELGSRDSLNVEPLKELMLFLEYEVQSEERIALNRNSFNTNTCKAVPQKSNVTAAVLLNNEHKRLCIFCDLSEHNSADCTEVYKWPVDQRRDRVKERGACFICLRSGHRSQFCRSKISCKKCKRRHSTVTCKFEGSPQNEPSLHAGNFNNFVYLKTILVKVLKGKHELVVRALLDDGCSRSYITESLAAKLCLTAKGTESTSHTLFGGVQTGVLRLQKYDVKVSSLSGDFSCMIDFLSQEKLCCDLPRINDKYLLKELNARGVKLTDIGPGNKEIEILLGAQAIGSLLTGKIEVLNCGVSAIQTKLGWSILGCNKKKVANVTSMCMFNLNAPQLWDLEMLGIEDVKRENSRKDSAREALSLFESTIKVDCEGRYETCLPWLVGHPPLADNKDLAEKRLRSVTNRLLTNGNFQRYHEVFKEWEKDGIIERAPLVSGREPVLHYLAHRPVFKDLAIKTKCRPVFDAGAPTRDGISLNNCLSAGPNLLQDIPKLLFQFRLGLYGITADIKQAFLMIALREDDRDALRFLWWNDGNARECIEFRHRRVVFGVTSSPFLLNASLKYHLRQEKYQCPQLRETLVKLENAFYCDDCISSVDTLEEYDRFRTQATDILREGKFDLRGWTRNGDRTQEIKVANVLGISWNLIDDLLYCKLPVVAMSDRSVTKRKLLSIVSRVYDPSGFLSPGLLIPKLLLQEAWRRRIEWDDELTVDLRNKFLKWEQYLPFLEKCTFPRRLHHGLSSLTCCQLHVFSDASAYACGSVVFLRCTGYGTVSVNLVASKTRLGPIGGLTIPRMELLASLLSVRLVKSLVCSNNLDIPITYWSDSMVALAWITKSLPWKDWVGNRVAEIREKSCIDNWRFVNGDKNPADLPSRECHFKFLYENSWFDGPQWLRETEENWSQVLITCPSVALGEQKSIEPVLFSAESTPMSEIIMNRFSSFSRIVRVVGFINRFIHNLKKGSVKSTGDLTASEVIEAENCIYRIIQVEWDTENIKKVSTSVSLFTDENRLIRVKTRLFLGDDEDSFKYPIVLPDSPLTRKIIMRNHLVDHAGVQSTLNRIRDFAWILNGRKIVKKVIKECVRCKRFSCKSVLGLPAPLPRERILLGAVFENVGVDLAGPLFLKNKQKAWIVLYTCAVYRAVHLELCTSLSTDSFLMSLRRFISRRGRPTCIMSDCGTNFVGASNAMKDLDWEVIKRETALEKILWKMQPPSAPWYGGFFERLIRVVKDLLRKQLGRSSVTYEEMNTILISCEKTVNERPLTYQSDASGELRPLTPANFLRDIPNGTCPDLDEIDRVCLLKRVKYRLALKERFKLRFRSEYLGLLVTKPNNGKLHPIRVGEIVLVGSDNVKRLMWPVGKVLKVFDGKDGVGRVARVKIANSELIRPVQTVVSP